MDELIKRIQKESEVDENGIIRVDMFLNHQLDVELLEDIGKALAKRFKNAKIDKVLTAESSGIAIAIFVAKALRVPAIYAKKFQTGFIDPDVYSTETHSFAFDKSYTLRVSQALPERRRPHPGGRRHSLQWSSGAGPVGIDRHGQGRGGWRRRCHRKSRPGRRQGPAPYGNRCGGAGNRPTRR